MSAEILRRAASLMAERAQAAHDVTGACDWFVEVRGMHFTGEYGVRSSGGFVCGDTVEEEAEHIASWHPAVALAVAGLLDRLAAEYDIWRSGATGQYVIPGHLSRSMDEALTVARAYLGESA